MRDNSGKNNWVAVIIIVVLLGGVFFLGSKMAKDTSLRTTPPMTSKGVKDIGVFKDGLASVGIDATNIGFHGFSPDGKYFFMSVFTDGATPANKAYLVRLSDGTITTLPGFVERGIDDKRIITLNTQEGTVIYWLQSGEQKTYDLGENVFFGSLSPDGKTYIANTSEGLRRVDIGTGVVTSFTKNRYDGAYAWFADSDQIFGFKETGENLFEAGKGRTLGIWDISTGDFKEISSPMIGNNVRNISWVVPEKIARVNTGWDDGSHDYLMDVTTSDVVDVGDTSGSLMGGVKVDSVNGYLAVVGGDDQSVMGSRGIMYKGMEKIYDIPLTQGYFRENMQIVNEETLIYLRKKWGPTQIMEQALVSLNLKIGQETVLQELPPKAFAALSLSADKKTWVLSNGALFILGTL